MNEDEMESAYWRKQRMIKFWDILSGPIHPAVPIPRWLCAIAAIGILIGLIVKVAE